MSWTNRPTNFTQTIEGDLVERANEIILFGHRGVVLKSPVKDGRFMNNNIISVGQESFQQRDITGENRNTAMTRGSQELARSRNVVYTTRYIQNNLPYGRKLEGGSSQQATQGVYGVTFNEIRVKFTL